MGKLVDELISMGDDSSLADSFRIGSIDTKGDIICHGGIEEDRLLVHISHETTEIIERDLTDVGTIDRDTPLDDIVEARDQIHEGTLPRARMPDERHGLSLANGEIHMP